MGEQSAADLVRIEAAGLIALADRLESSMAESFEHAVSLVMQCGTLNGRVVLTGMGKSGIIAQKIAATLSSTGTPAMFLHPAEALHGDVGMVARGDVVIALSASGETEEILRLLPLLKRIGDAVIAFCCEMRSTLGENSDVSLDCSVPEEACVLGLAPTASSTAMLALGDALASAVSMRKGFKLENFADLHPGGKLGKRLARVGSLMHAGDAIPRVGLATPMTEVIYEMSRKKLGVATVMEGGMLCGLISDGDLRRLLEAKGPDGLKLTAADAMNAHPKTIAASELAARALHQMEEMKITSLVVLGPNLRVEGIVHLHDLWGLDLM